MQGEDKRADSCTVIAERAARFLFPERPPERNKESGIFYWYDYTQFASVFNYFVPTIASRHFVAFMRLAEKSRAMTAWASLSAA